MDLHEAMRTTGSTRHYRPDPVPREALHRALDCARFAPSGGNRQGWRVVAVDDPDLRRSLAELYLPLWQDYRAVAQTGRVPHSALGEGDGARVATASRVLQDADAYAHAFAEIPLQLVICVQIGALAVVDTDRGRPSIVGGASIYPFVQNLQLALRAEGLGSTFSSFLAATESEVRQLLGIPDDVAVAGNLSVGYRRDAFPTRLTRHAVETFAFRNRFGAEPISRAGGASTSHP